MNIEEVREYCLPLPQVVKDEKNIELLSSDDTYQTPKADGFPAK